jgi:hypothetical protein
MVSSSQRWHRAGLSLGPARCCNVQNSPSRSGCYKIHVTGWKPPHAVIPMVIHAVIRVVIRVVIREVIPAAIHVCCNLHAVTCNMYIS